MSKLASRLHQAVAAVAPVESVAVGDPRDGTTWVVTYAGATADQIAAGDAALLAVFKGEVKGWIDADAERVRAPYITPGSGQAMTYQEKGEQANAVLDLGEEAANALSEAERVAQFPVLAASVGIEAPTLFAAADLVMSRKEALASLGGAIERTRLGAKKAVGDAADVAGVHAAYGAIVWPT
jgi:hypothetical protein